MTIRGATIKVIDSRPVHLSWAGMHAIEHKVHFLSLSGEVIFEFWSDGLYIPKYLDIAENLRYACYEEMKNAAEDYRQRVYWF